MATEVIMPQMGESIAEGTITKWYKQVGEAVERDEPLFEISTDKVDTEIPSPVTGVLTEIKVNEGETVPINTVVAVIGGEGEVAVPEADVGEGAEEAPVEPVEVGAEVGAETETERTGPVEEETPIIVEPEEPVAPGTDRERGIRSSPLVRRIAREHGVDLALVPGTGRDGRITKDDVMGFIEKSAPVAEPAAAPPAAAPPVEAPVVTPAPVSTPAAAGTREDRVKMSVMRTSIAEHMLASRRTSAHVATVFEADVTGIVKLREGYKDRFAKEEGGKLTYTPFFIRAVIGGLKAFPILNASIEGDEIVYKKDINIGVAVSLDWGLIVPVIRNADEKSFLGLNRAIADLAERARTKKLQPTEVQGGTFTLTNPGPFGGLYGIPIINQPQVAILGMGGIHKRPVVVGDGIAIRDMVYLALSFDHRLIDGAVADQFMAEVKKRLENWEEKII
jgi:2-oxoglutarate dehydrogenase E2 component (dihydrolipoamide succinyltransferase)